MDTAKISFANCRDDKLPMTVWLEPLGEDYTLLAGESLEIIATGEPRAPWFGVNAYERDLAVYVEGDRPDASVRQNGVAIACGHNRWVRPEIGPPVQ